MVAVISNIYTHLLSPFVWLPYCCFCYSAVCERASCVLASCVCVCSVRVSVYECNNVHDTKPNIVCYRFVFSRYAHSAPSSFLSLYHSPFRSTVVLVTLFAICTEYCSVFVYHFRWKCCIYFWIALFCLFASLKSVRVIFSCISLAFSVLHKWIVCVWMCMCANCCCTKCKLNRAVFFYRVKSVLAITWILLCSAFVTPWSVYFGILYGSIFLFAQSSSLNLII